MIRRDLVQLALRGGVSVRLQREPPLPDDPLAFGRPLGLPFDEIEDRVERARGPLDLDVFDRRNVAARGQLRVRRRAVEVDVGVDESRQGDPAPQVDYLGFLSDQRLDVGVSARGEDPVAGYRDRIDDRRGGIHRDDLAVAQDEIRPP